MMDDPSQPASPFFDTKDRPEDDSSGQHPHYDKKKLLLGLQKHWILILLSAAVAALLGVLIGHRLQQSYTARAVILYDSGERSSTQQNPRPFETKQLSLPTILDMILLPEHIETVQKILGLDLDPSKIRSMFSVPTPKGNSTFIHLIAKSEQPQLSVDLANTLARVSVNVSQEYARKQLQAALKAYEQELQSIKQTESYQHELMEKFKIDNAYFDMKPDETLFLTRLQEARDLRDKTVLEYKGLQIQYNTLKKKIEETPELVPLSARWNENPLYMRIANMEATLAEARAKYTKNNPKLLQLEEELETVLRNSQSQLTQEGESSGMKERNEFRQKLELELAQLKGKMRSAKQAKGELESSVKTLEQRLSLLPSQQVALMRLLQDIEITQDRVKEARRLVDSVRQQISIPSGNLEIYQMAKSAKGFDDSFILNFLPVLGLMMGAGFGVICSLLFEMNDKYVRTGKQCQLYYPVPCIATIPQLGLFLRSNAYQKFLFFIRSIADRLDRTRQEKMGSGSSIIAFTSSIRGEGKSLLSALTAEYYARLDKKVLLLEMDPRKHSLLKSPPDFCPFGDYLRQSHSLERLICKGDYDRILLGGREPSLKELLKSPQAVHFWEECTECYDLIFIDTPGILEEDYALDLCLVADQVLLIVGSSVVEKSVVDETMHLLEPCVKHLEGIILNGVDKTYISGRRLRLETKRANGGFWSYLYDLCTVRK